MWVQGGQDGWSYMADAKRSTLHTERTMGIFTGFFSSLEVSTHQCVSVKEPSTLGKESPKGIRTAAAGIHTAPETVPDHSSQLFYPDWKTPQVTEHSIRYSKGSTSLVGKINSMQNTVIEPH